MTSVTKFRLTTLALMVGIMGVSTNSYAVFNLYKKDGLTLDINGQLDIQASKQDYKHTVLNDIDGRNWQKTTRPFYENINTPHTLQKSDKKTRLGQTHGVSFVEFRGSQALPNDWRVTGQIGLGYSDARDMYLNNTSLSLDKKDLGAITLGRQYLHTNYVNRSGTDTPLDIFSQSAVRLDYYGVKGLHASAYYSLSDLNDVRQDSNSGIKSGFGTSTSYRFSLANNQNIRVAAGYSEHSANPKYTPLFFGGSDYGWIDNDLNQYAKKTRGVAASVEYQVGKFLVAADIGRKTEKMADHAYSAQVGFTPLDTRTSDYLGAKIAYDINPVFQVSAGYGSKKADTKLKQGVTPLTTNGRTLQTKADFYSYVDGDDTHLFDKAKTREAYVQADYRIRPNVRLYTRYDREKTSYKVANTTTNEVVDNNVRAGVVFSF